MKYVICATHVALKSDINMIMHFINFFNSLCCCIWLVEIFSSFDYFDSATVFIPVRKINLRMIGLLTCNSLAFKLGKEKVVTFFKLCFSLSSVFLI